MNAVEYNKRAWDRQVESGENIWTIPVSSEQITAARRGEWSIVLTEQKKVPASWFPKYPFLYDLDVLCLASGGGQQGPILAAAGANVTVFDNSPKQLEQDRFVAERDDLHIVTIEGDAADLSCFDPASFDLIVHPVSNLFFPEVLPVWREAFRVLRKGGVLMSGFMNPDIYIFDVDLAEGQKIFTAKYALPFTDLKNLDEDTRRKYFGDAPLEHSHTLVDQIGGQIDAGFVISGFYDDRHVDETQAARFVPTYFVTKAIKP